MQTSVYQGVRCFVSMDLVGSTAMKLHGTPNTSGTRLWPDIIRHFYEVVSIDFLSGNLPYGMTEKAHAINMHLWKSAGDEVLFYSDRLSAHEQFTYIFARLYKTLRSVHERFQGDRLGVKATIWAAGFPNRNREMLVSSEPPYYRFITGPFHSKEEFFRDTPFLELDQRLDFLGPEIDLGFRLGSHVNPGRIVSSLDVAFFLSRNATTLVPTVPVHVHHVGWSRLKGVYGERPYPIIWLDGRARHELPVPITAYEAAESTYAHDFLQGTSRINESMTQLYLRYVGDSDGTMIPMYVLPTDDMPKHDKDVYVSLGREGNVI